MIDKSAASFFFGKRKGGESKNESTAMRAAATASEHG
jgi:hypothetical protein